MNTPQLSQLLEQFIRQQAAAPRSDPAEHEGEVALFEAAAGVQLVDAGAAFKEALEAVDHLADGQVQFGPESGKPPVEWAGLLRGQEVGVALPFCLGNFPQMIRSLSPFWNDTDLTHRRPSPVRSFPLEGTLERGQKALADGKPAEALLAAALLRTAQQFEQAGELLDSVGQKGPYTLKSLLLNEEAALAWHRGEHARAAELWAGHPRQDSPVIQFNRGLAALFANDREAARGFLNIAADVLPERSSWRHLAKLYLTLAESAAL